MAHSQSRSGRWQPWVEHARNVAGMAGAFAAPFDGAAIAHRVGLLHDAGKLFDRWQDKLARVAAAGGAVRIDHKALGAEMVRTAGYGKIAAVVLGHHGGLVDGSRVRGLIGKLLGENPDEAAAEATVRRLLPELADSAPGAIPPAWVEDPLVGELGVRMVFSALCDADHLDTAAHFADEEAPRVRPDSDFCLLADHFAAARARYLAARAPTRMDAAREAVYQHCMDAALSEQGIFRLGVPTGYAKTLGAAGFALRHAAQHGLRRVVMAVPFLTITEQNAAVLRGLLDGAAPAPVVLEHHSGVDLDAAGRQARLASENWDAPVVVTTFVRLFESLLGRKPSVVRRLHRLARSVIVLDEVQALPATMLLPILDVLRILVQHFGVTVLLCSATQPDFWHLSPFRQLPATDVVPDLAALPPGRQRTRFRWRTQGDLTLADVAAETASGGSVLVVVNTTADARTVFDAWSGMPGVDSVWHLSTRMCPEHRRRVLVEVRRRLSCGLPVRLVATQLIEAGVDVDFPVVWRAFAPADSHVQVAGRADREGTLADGGEVVIFSAVDASQPPTYRMLLAATRRHCGPDSTAPDDPDSRVTPDDPAALIRYYHEIYDNLNLEDAASVGQRIQRARRGWQFETVTDGPQQGGRRDRSAAFRLIDDDGLAVVTPQAAVDEATRTSLHEAIVRVRAHPTRDDLRLLHPYTTTLHPSALRAAGVTALLRPVLGQLAPGGLAEWVGAYDASTGMSVDTKVEEFVL
ncbi:CRISPR-associated endonuclease Cas3'' [Actinocatenispora rupis]|uniref:CRISPR-associated endonuclease Cas3'' n=1 Tax=Actinocatenispora rupis TaxID=519421 RepID=UPI0023B235E5